MVPADPGVGGSGAARVCPRLPTPGGVASGAPWWSRSRSSCSWAPRSPRPHSISFPGCGSIASTGCRRCRTPGRRTGLRSSWKTRDAACRSRSSCRRACSVQTGYCSTAISTVRLSSPRSTEDVRVHRSCSPSGRRTTFSSTSSSGTTRARSSSTSTVPRDLDRACRPRGLLPRKVRRGAAVHGLPVGKHARLAEGVRLVSAGGGRLARACTRACAIARP